MDRNLKSTDWIGRRVEVIVDRPLGSSHPEDLSMVYEVNHGFVPGTMAPDGEPLDVLIIDAEAPLDACEAEVIAIIRRRDDVADKLVVRIGDRTWSPTEIERKTSQSTGRRSRQNAPVHTGIHGRAESAARGLRF